MATITGTTSRNASKYSYYITWSESSVNSTNNTSVVTASVYAKKISDYSASGSSNPQTLYIDGTAFTDNNSINLTTSTAQLCVSGSKTITHNTDGSKSISISASGTLPYGSGYGPESGSASGTATLTTITRQVTVTSTAASSVGGTSATVGGNVTDAGIPSATSRGIYWGTSADSQPNLVTSGSGSGAFSANITGLTYGTTYYFKAFAVNSSGYRYGSVLNFTTTTSAPSVSTGSSSSVAATTATVSGTVTSDNGATVTSRGICYGTSTNPTTSGSKVVSGSGTGAFSANLTSLTPSTLYYARAYAINSQGTSYGANITFTTIAGVPTVTTTSGATSITTSQATVAGNVVSANGSSIYQRGFVYALTENPTIVNSKVTVTGTTGAMSKTITGLSAGTTYHFRAFARNGYGTGYGDDSTFTTLPDAPSGLTTTVIDKDTINLSWTKGVGGNYTIIRRGTTAPANINSGDLIYQGTGSSVSDTSCDAGTLYYYRAWSATTEDWSEAYSSTYTSASATSIADFVNPENALTDGADYTTIPANDGKLYAMVSKDGGVNWSISKELTFTASVETKNFGLGISELWGTTFVGSDLDDGNFEVKLIGGSGSESYQVYDTFGFSILDTAILTGVQVQVKAAYDGNNILLYFIKSDGYYGSSSLPIGEGSLAYDTTLSKPTYYDGEQWQGLVDLTSTQNLSGKSIDADYNTIGNLEVDNFKESAKTGIETKIVTGIKGIPTRLSMWDENGDIVDSEIWVSKASNCIDLGWNGSLSNPVYEGASSPIFTMYVSGNVVLPLGAKIHVVQSTSKYFILHNIGSYDSENDRVLLTLYGGTDYTLTDSAISSASFSYAKCPYGFPINPLKWTITASISNYSNTSASAGTIYNVGSIALPVGIWNCRYEGVFRLNYFGSGWQATPQGDIGIGTANNALDIFADTLEFNLGDQTTSSYYAGLRQMWSREETLETTGTTRYLNVRPNNVGATTYRIYANGNTAKAVDAYL